MIAGILGFFGSIVGAVVSTVTAATGLVFFIVLWKSGALPPLIGIVGDLITGFFGFMAALLRFLGDLVGSVF